MVRGEICYVFMEGGDTGEEWVVKKLISDLIRKKILVPQGLKGNPV